MKKILYNVALFASVALFSACSLDEYNPSAGDATLENVDTWEGLQVNCYSTLYHELYSKIDFLVFSETGTDLWLHPAGVETYRQFFYYDGIDADRVETRKSWQQAYSVIATCNTVVNHAPGGERAAILAAEAKCIRAFMHLTLTTYYGPITLSTGEIGELNMRPVRNSLPEVYASIVKDLQEAAAVLPVQPLDGNYARVCKKTALGLLARAYAQGAGEGLTENGVSYWQRAKEVAEDMIANAADYDVYLYSDVDDLWAWDNNRGNKEFLFNAAGLDAKLPEANMAGYYFNVTSYLYAYMMCEPNKAAQDLYKVAKASDVFLGAHGGQGCVFAPTKHAIEVFADWDKRYENSFMTAFGQYSIDGNNAYTNAKRSVKITNALCTKYGIDKSFVNDSIHTYVNMGEVERPGGKQNYVLGVYEKGNPNKTTANFKNPFVVPQPLDYDEDRISIWISKKDLTPEERAKYRMGVINFSQLFDENGNYTDEKISFGGAKTQMTSVFPSLIKYNWAYDGVTREGGYPYRNGDIPVMRTAELYLIAAEAECALGNAGEAAKYIQPLWNRAARGGNAPKVTGVDEQFILDEYAREFVGEHMRWAVLKRHNVLKSSLDKYNKRAAANWRDVYIWRPIPQTFLEQIENADEYGDNGYGYNGIKGY